MPDQPGKHVLPCLWKYSYNTPDCVAREIRTFNFGKKCKKYFPLWQKKAVKAKTSNLPIVKIIQKALHQKFPVTCCSK